MGCKVLNEVCGKTHHLPMESIGKGILSVKNGKCRVKGLVLGAEPDPHTKLFCAPPPPPPCHYDLWSQSKRQRNVCVLIFAVADVVT